MLNELINKVMLIPTPIDQSYNKVIAVIESCETKEQLSGAHYLVNNFKFLYEKVGYPKILSYIIDKTIHKKYKTCQ